MGAPMRALALLATALLALTAVSGARPAPAPAPAAGKPLADLLFMLTAGKAVFTSPSQLALEGLQASATGFNTETHATATYTLATFANVTAGAPFAAVWAAAPDALMYATRAGAPTTALVRLSEPAFDAAAGRLTFAARLLPADAAQLATAGGVTARAVDDAANGIGSSMLTQAPVGADLTAVALFMDVVSAEAGPAATAKDGWGGGGWGGGGWGGGGWGGGWNQGGGGWDQGYQNQQNSNINNNNVVQNQGYNSSPSNINNNNVQNNGYNNGGNTNINNNNVASGQNNGNTNVNNNNVGNNGVNINNNNVG